MATRVTRSQSRHNAAAAAPEQGTAADVVPAAVPDENSVPLPQRPKKTSSTRSATTLVDGAASSGLSATKPPEVTSPRPSDGRPVARDESAVGNQGHSSHATSYYSDLPSASPPHHADQPPIHSPWSTRERAPSGNSEEASHSSTHNSDDSHERRESTRRSEELDEKVFVRAVEIVRAQLSAQSPNRDGKQDRAFRRLDDLAQRLHRGFSRLFVGESIDDLFPEFSFTPDPPRSPSPPRLSSEQKGKQKAKLDAPRK